MKIYPLILFLLVYQTIIAQDTVGTNRSSKDLQFVMENQSLEAGQQYVLDLKAPTLHEYLGYQYTFQFDQNKIHLDSILLNDYSAAINLSANNFNTNFLDSGAFTNIWSTTGINENPEAVIFSIQVTVIADATTEQAFRIDSELIPVLSLCIDGTEAGVDLIFDQLNSLDNLNEKNIALFPNPITNRLINLEWSFDQNVHDIWIVNTLGETVFSKKGSFVSPLQIELNELETGYYFINYLINKEMYSSPFCVLKN